MNNGLKGTINNPDVIYGKSAYEIAVMHGFEGTEEEWIVSLTEQTKLNAAEVIEEADKQIDMIKTAEEEAVAHIESMAEEALKIVQTTGNSETSVMSQKAVTESLGGIARNMNAVWLNMIDLEKIEYSKFLTSLGSLATDDRYCTTDFIKVTPNDTLLYKVYDLSLESTADGEIRMLVCYGEDKLPISVFSQNIKGKYVVPEGVSYIRISVKSYAVEHAVLTNSITLPDTYKPYGKGYTATEAFMNDLLYSKEEVDKKDNNVLFELRKKQEENLTLPIEYEQGFIDVTTGENSTSEPNYFIRSKGMFDVKYGDELVITLSNDQNAYLYKYTEDGAFVERSNIIYSNRIVTMDVTESCKYRVVVKKSSGYITPAEISVTLTITTMAYKRQGVTVLNEAYVEETDKVTDSILDKPSHLRLLCFADPHSFDAYKYLKYDEIMSRGVIDFLVGLGDYVDYKDHGAKANYRKLLLNSINKAGRETNRIYVTGNHDVSMKAGVAAGTSDIDLVLYPMECFDMFYRHLKSNIVVDPVKPYGCYFYVDDIHSKTRLIVLNSNEIVNDDGTVTWYYEQSKISRQQLNWFANTALKVDEDGWSVVVFLHNDAPYGYKENVLFEILAAAKNGTSLSKEFTAYQRMVLDSNGNATSTVDKVNGDDYLVAADYHGGHTVDVIGIIHGHTHEKDWRVVNGINSICVRNDGVHLNDRYISRGTFARNTTYYFTNIYGHMYSFTTPDTNSIDQAVQFEYCAYHTKSGNATAGYFVKNDGNQFSFSITPITSVPSGATEITGFVRERDGSLAGNENCEVLCINKDERTITTIPYGTGTSRTISY